MPAVIMVRHQARRPDRFATLPASRSQEQQGRVIIRLLQKRLHLPHATLSDMRRHLPSSVAPWLNDRSYRIDGFRVVVQHCVF